MALGYEDFLRSVIEDGIEAATRDYTKPDQAHKLAGSLAGFEACRGKSPEELAVLLLEIRRKVAIMRFKPLDDERDYWHWRCHEAEVEWVCNVVSAALLNEGKTTIVPPSANGMMAAAKILGVRGFKQVGRGLN